ncbi:hypothetical protein E4U12_005493, partial [Claviceps purpurea]
MKPDRADHASVQGLIQTLKHAGAKQAQILKAVNTQLLVPQPHTTFWFSNALTI